MSIIINPYAFSGGGFTPLGNIVASCVFDLAADQYVSGQTFANQETTPADGTSQTNSDCWFGADGSSSTDDPTFATDKFTFDGGDLFTFKSGGGGTLAGMHRTDVSKPATFGIHFKTAGTLGTSYLLSTLLSGSVQGLRVRINTDGSVSMIQEGTGAQSNDEILAASTFATSTEYVLLVGFNTNSTGSEFVALNADTGSAWSASYTPDTTNADVSDTMNIGSVGGAAALPNGFEIYNVCLFNEILSDANIAAVRTELLARRT